MKVLVTGVCGQLGRDVSLELLRRGSTVTASDVKMEAEAAGLEKAGIRYRRMDIADAGQVHRAIREERPDAVIHCAAWTAVDEAEENEEKVYAINSEGTRHLAEACRAIGSKLAYISTDYVFCGRGEEPWKADCTDFAPLNVCGRSKLEGESAVRQTLEQFFIVRTAWVFGTNGNNFVRTMLRLGKTHEEIRVVSDQIGTPTYTPDLSRLLADMIETERYGIYHATNEGGYISWYDFACEIFRQAGMPVHVIPVTTEEYGLNRADRPRNSRLDRSKLEEAGFRPLPHWRDALGRYLAELLKEPSEPKTAV